MNETEAVAAAIARRIDAMERHDAAAAVALLDPLVVAFEVAGPLEVPPEQARDAAANQAWLDSFASGPKVEVSDARIYAEGSIAFCHSLHRLTGTTKGGREIDIAMRSTLGLRKTDGEWLIVHAHTSVPR
ncbi:MAG: YybH family protein [Bacillota bacterium]